MPPAPDRRAADGAPPGSDRRPGCALRLIGTSDLHANIFPYDYYRDRPDDTGRPRQDRRADRRGARRGANSILLDNGDIIQGTPLGDYVARRAAWPPATSIR